MQRMQFIASQRNQVGGELKTLIEEFQESFREEFTIRPIQDSEDIEAAMEELQEAFPNNTVKFPLEVFEYIWQTFNTEASFSTEFGIPIIKLNNAHASNKVAWTEIELDYDDEIFTTEKIFAVCVDAESKSFGKVVMINEKKKICPVGDSFLEFFALYVRMMVDDLRGTDVERKTIISDFYEQFNLPIN
ncbi:hypothetical protein HDV06_005224 [Boothiomyces sp. JEL0866]|nr:hypothetical protein HDV06_005224 [Boothiomyces sp. JEL0866]